ncbi:MAG: hypothetical protein LH468_05440 [Nocardioides sp.]|nr:hypothetical protein [Nocardioides sp.]
MSQPASLTRLLWTQWVLYALGLLTTVLTWAREDDLVRAWAEGRADLRRTLATGGLEAIRSGGIAPPAFVPVAVVLFVVLASLVWVLLAFVRVGYGWARLTITGVLVFMAVATVAGIRTSPPSLFVALAAVSFLVELVMLAFLWHRDTSAHVRGTWQPSGADAPTTV